MYNVMLYNYVYVPIEYSYPHQQEDNILLRFLSTLQQNIKFGGYVVHEGE